MPRVELVLYQEDDGTVPIRDWLDELVPKARDKCLVRFERLEESGHELRRPAADYLGDDIYELGVKRVGLKYRMLISSITPRSWWCCAASRSKSPRYRSRKSTGQFAG